MVSEGHISQNRRLSKEDFVKIASAIKADELISKIAREFGCSVVSISRYKSRVYNHYPEYHYLLDDKIEEIIVNSLG